MSTKSIRQGSRRRKDTDPLRSAYHVLEEWFEENRRRILVIGGIALGLTLLFGLLYYFLDYRREKALNAYADAFKKFTATVSADPAKAPAAPGTVTYPDEATKYNEAGAAFEKLADDYSSYDDLGHYYAGVSYLHTDSAKGVKLLEDVAKGSSDVRPQAVLALGEYYVQQGQFEQAESYFKQLDEKPGALPVQYVKTRLGYAEEKLGKPAEAAALYKAAIDIDRTSPTGVEAEKGLQRVDPKQAAALPPKTPPPGSAPAVNSTQGPQGLNIGK